MSLLMQWGEDGRVRSMSKDGGTPDPGDCTNARIRFLAGSGVTDSTAFWKLDLAAAACGPLGKVQSVSFVATTTFPAGIGSPEPISISTSWYGTFLYAYTWDCNCKPRPDTPFDFHVAITEIPM